MTTAFGHDASQLPLGRVTLGLLARASAVASFDALTRARAALEPASDNPYWRGYLDREAHVTRGR